ncbi:STAS/SEC14 domain-containing protein [Mangrovivirga cuniculi]|uniref:STAS/SEC14 domain-containing protein n=1 Tax=Mangrovivirga cuniculi TaxID=2715131 RepID=A0A4D7JNU9_9BACT|nr:STAS/SEC14 domain-containing protein [Mangrovivirga cuniculi]QCK14462.1 hypothetical protein DCC35_06760 [Mangrovivirga cuniculi]
MKLLFEHDKADLYFNQETNSIELIWKKYQDADTYKLLFTKGIEFLKDFGATGWLSDIRKEGVVGPSSSRWLQDEAIPKAIGYGLSRIAVVMDSDIFKQVYVGSINKKTENKMMNHFDSLENARDWLALSNTTLENA